MKGSLQTVWRWVKWPLVVLIVAYLALVVWRAFDLYDQDKTAAAVAAIHAARITLADVEGVNLLPQPNQEENDATVEGIDKNNNGIRDDVELAIFAKYPTDKKARAAALQYAMAEQMYLTKVTNTPTWKAVAEEVGRAGLCLLETKANRKDVDGLVFDTQARKDYKEKIFGFITSYGPAEGMPCDILIGDLL